MGLFFVSSFSDLSGSRLFFYHAHFVPPHPNPLIPHSSIFYSILSLCLYRGTRTFFLPIHFAHSFAHLSRWRMGFISGAEMIGGPGILLEAWIALAGSAPSIPHPPPIPSFAPWAFLSLSLSPFANVPSPFLPRTQNSSPPDRGGVFSFFLFFGGRIS